MRVHPISLALRYLKGQKAIRGAPYYGGSPFAGPEEAVDVLRHATGQDFGTDAVAWGEWLRRNRRVYRESWADLAAEQVPVTEAQKQDLERRLADLDADPAAGSSWEDVKARLLGG